MSANGSTPLVPPSVVEGAMERALDCPTKAASGPSEDLAHLDALLTLLRRHGVRRYKDIELVPFVALPPTAEVATPAPETPDLKKPDVLEQVERDLFPPGLGG